MSTRGYRLSCNAGWANRLSPWVSKPAQEQGLPGRISLMSPNGCASPSSHRKAGTRGGKMNAQGLVAGIDVSKDWLDVAIGNESSRVANDAAGIGSLLERLG